LIKAFARCTPPRARRDRTLPTAPWDASELSCLPGLVYRIYRVSRRRMAWPEFSSPAPRPDSA
jgi:hypothetical protein